MSALYDCLDRLADRPLGTVVHVNPSETEVIQRYAALGAQRVVLVVGDPESLPGLRRLTAGRPWLEIVEAAVSPTPGPAAWLRYNVPGLGGLLEAEALHSFYPRLQLLERTPVTTVGLQAVLERLQIATPADRPNLLVLEAPGMDAPLLERLDPPTLTAFAWLLVRAARQDLYRGGVAETAASRLLQARHYRNVHASREGEPLWSAALLRFDAAAAAQAVLAERVASLQAQVASLTVERDEADRRATACAQEQQAQLGKARDEQARLAAERAAQVEQLTKARDAYAKQSSERHERIAQLDAEMTDLSARYALLQEELIKAEAHVELISDLLLRESVR